jgi:two-component system, OmpR family, alkaline phosphatase synthesis response regulator PhoP
MRDMGDKKPFRVLLIDDDQDILELLEYNLEREGYKVKTVEDSNVAVSVANDFSPDLIILDIMMPHPNGIEICKELRGLKKFADTYIFFLTAKSESYYQEAALDTGGDDYIEKVVGLRALTYKVSTVLKRRFVIRKSVPELHVGNISLNRKANTVSINQQKVTLSKPEFELLFFFAQNPRKIISEENLLCNIWGSEIYLFDTSIDVYIQNLRAKLGLDVIQSFEGQRYRFDVRA